MQLGFAGEFIDTPPSNSSFFGGEPVFYNGIILDEFKCIKCKKQLHFLGQIYAPVNNLDRTVYMYTCRKQRCTGSSEGWMFTSQQAPKPVEELPKKKKSVWGTTLDLSWGDTDDAWGEICGDDWGLSDKPCDPKSNDSKVEKPVSLEEEGRKSKPDADKDQESSHGAKKEEERSSWDLNKSTWWYKPFYIAFEYEKRRIGIENEEVRIPDDVDEKGGTGGEVEDEPTWTSGDQEIEFGLRLRENPEQLLRYKYKGKLLSAVLDGSGASEEQPLGKHPHCEKCGVGLTFEFQLMPNLIRVLKEVTQCEYVHLMEWTTVIVFTCHRCYQCKWIVQCL